MSDTPEPTLTLSQIGRWLDEVDEDGFMGPFELEQLGDKVLTWWQLNGGPSR